VAKLGFVCSPSVMTGDPVASNFSIVSRTASLHIDANSSCDMLPRSYRAKASISFCGRGMLPIGSVGIVISKSRKNSETRQARQPAPASVDDLEMTVETLSLGCQTSEYCPFRAGRYCQARILLLLDDLIPPPAESGLQIRNEALAKVSRPVTEARQSANWVNSTPTPVAEQQLEALRKLPRTW
jgi:hypothetical protein